MSDDSRRSPRLTDYLPLEVHVVTRESNDHIAGPFAGRIIDLSSHGACLLMSQVLQASFHVFHSTLKNDAADLELRISLPPDFEQCRLAARPIWINRFEQGEIRAFKMGVEFIDDPDLKKMQEVHELIRVNQKHRADWWQTHFKR